MLIYGHCLEIVHLGFFNILIIYLSTSYFRIILFMQDKNETIRLVKVIRNYIKLQIDQLLAILLLRSKVIHNISEITANDMLGR